MSCDYVSTYRGMFAPGSNMPPQGKNEKDPVMPTFETTGGQHITAEAMVDGILLNPKLPDRFSYRPNEERSDEEIATWWGRPFIQRNDGGEFEVWCLDGRCHDRPTFWGRDTNLDEATTLAWERLEKTGSKNDVAKVLADALKVLRKSESPEP